MRGLGHSAKVPAASQTVTIFSPAKTQLRLPAPVSSNWDRPEPAPPIPKPGRKLSVQPLSLPRLTGKSLSEYFYLRTVIGSVIPWV